jgi:hypothetical protein
MPVRMCLADPVYAEVRIHQPMDMMKRLLKEPLLHFLLLGVVLFLAYGVMQKPGRSDEPGEIVVTQGEIEHLAAGFARTWQRPPGAGELAGLVRDRVREEVYYREAMAMGLDKDDTVIRRRLRQKMEFISDDIAARAEPAEADLNAYLQAHPDAFRVEPRYTFEQVYLNPQKHGDKLARDAAQLRAQLNQGGDTFDPLALGDSTMLEHRFTSVPVSEVAKQFGETFSAKLPELAQGQWQGPVESGYGVHLVLVSERTEGHLPALAEVRDAVRREWDNARRLEANDRFYQELLKRYTVTIESTGSAAEQKKVAENTAK